LTCANRAAILRMYTGHRRHRKGPRDAMRGLPQELGRGPIDTGIGVCHLCHKPAILQMSHLLPKAAYRLLRDTTVNNPNPILVSKQGAVSTSQQVKQPFLCRTCEDKFSKRGEHWVMSQCARSNNCFPLREALQTTRPLASENDFYAYALETVAKRHISDCIYFAASVFWRAAAAPWPCGSKVVPRLPIGPYEEPLRRFLLDERPFPSEIIIWLWSIPKGDSVMLTHVPAAHRARDGWQHYFVIPGLLFFMFVGNRIPDCYRQLSLTDMQPKAILAPSYYASPFRHLRKLVKEGPLLGRLRRSDMS